MDTMYTTRSHSYHMSHVYRYTICTTCSHRYHVYHMFTWILYVPHVHTDIMSTTCLQWYHLYHMLTRICVPCVYMDTMCSTRGSPFMLNSPFWPHTSFLYSKVESILLLYMSVSLSLPPCSVWYECQQVVMERANAGEQLRFQLTSLGTRHYI